MGFKYWQEAFIFVVIFSVIVIVPCYFIARIGSAMFNDLGNFPSRSAEIQSKAFGKLLGIVIGALIALSLFFHMFN